MSNVNHRTAKAVVSKVKRSGGEDVDTTKSNFSLPTGKALINPARLSYARGETYALATKFEFSRIDVSLEVPCEMNTEAIEAAYKLAKEWVDEKISSIEEEIK